MADHIRLDGLRVDAHVGVYPHEHGIRQRLDFDVELETSHAASGRSDRVEDTIDYDQVAAIVRRIATSGHHQLVEALAHRSAEALLEAFGARVDAVDVWVKKPGAVPDAANTSVHVSRRRGAPARPTRLVLGRHTLPLGERTLVMGVVNATPDSFYDRGRFFAAGDPTPAIERARALVAEGADLVDVGGETAQPSSPVLTPDEEIRRVVPVIEALAAAITVPISVDTYKPEVARAAIAAGASLINDTSGLADPRLGDVAAETGAGILVMHIVGHPKERRTPGLGDAVDTVGRFLVERARHLESLGIAKERILIDPGVGFGKTTAENYALVGGVGALQRLGYPTLFACSRRTFLGELFGGLPPEDRLEPTAAVNAAAMLAGVDVVRVHDVRFFARMSKTMAVVRAAGR